MAERRSTYADRHGENFVCKRIALIYSTRSLILNQWRDLRIAKTAGVRQLGALTTTGAREFWIC